MSNTSQEHAGFLKAISQSTKDGLNVAIPVTIVAVNGDRVDIIPDIQRGPMLGDRTRDYKETTTIFGIPVVNLSCGGFVINIPLQAGCKGLYIHCDYDIDNWLNGNPVPNTARTHDLNDGFFIPAFNGGDNEVDNIEIRSDNAALVLANDGFDFYTNGNSFLTALNGCCPGIISFKGSA